MVLPKFNNISSEARLWNMIFYVASIVVNFVAHVCGNYIEYMQGGVRY